MICLPSYIDPECWSAFLESRKAHKAPFTPQAQKLMVRRLIRAHDDGWDVNKALEDAAINGWKSIYPKDKIAREVDGRDPTLVKLDRDSAQAVPMPAAVREKIKSMFRIRVNQNTQSAE